MMPTGPPAPGGGAQSVGPPLFRANSGSLGGAAQSQSQPQFSLVSPRNQFSNSLLGNMSSVSGFLNNHSFGNGVPGSGLSGLQQRGGVVGAEQDPMTFTSSSSPGQQQFLNNYGSDRQPSPQLDAMQNFQASHSQLQQQQLHGGMFNGGSMGPVKSEELGEQNSSQRGGIGPVKLDQQQQLQSLRGLGSVKMDSQHSEQSMFLQHHQQQKQQQQQQHQQQQQQQQQQHQQQQQILQLSRQNSPTTAAQLNMLQHQRIMQLQQQQQQQKQQLQQHQHQQLQQHQQQSLNTLPQQRTQLQQQLRQNMPTQVKPSGYEPGTCARRLTQYMYQQQQRPEDNNIEFWRKFVTDFFAPTAKKRWCVSLYGSGRQTTGVFPQDAWHCEICNRKPVRGFETTFEVLPRLCQIKYASGTLEELLYVDMPHEYHNASGQIVLDYAKAIQESVFEQLRVVRDGQLRIVFNSDLKICSWEFCARHHEELIPRRLLIPQVSQLGAVIQKSQAAGQNGQSEMSTQDLLNSCNSFVSSARQLVKALEVPLVNDLGYTKRYVRCLQISEVVNSMKDLIDYSRETRIGPIDSLNNFPRRTSTSLGTPSQQEAQQSIPHNANHSDQGPVHATMQLPMAHSGPSMNNHHNAASSTSTITAATLLHQNSMNSRQENQMGAVNSPYRGGITAPIPSTSSSSSLPPMHPNPSCSNNAISNSHHQLNSVSSPVNISSLGADPNDSQSSVQQILQELSSQLNGVGGAGNKMKISNGIGPMINGGNGLTNNGIATSSSGPAIGGMPYRSTGGFGTSATVNGIRGAITNNALSMDGSGINSVAREATVNGIRGAITNNALSMDGSGINSVARDPTGMSHQQLQDMGNRLLGRFGTANNFNNLQFD